MPQGPGAGVAPAAAAPRTMLLFLVVVMTWGTGWLPIRYQVGEVAPEVTLFWRFLIAGALLWGLVWWRGAHWRYPPAIHVRLVFMGLGMFGINYLLMYNAARHLPTGTLAVVFSTASLYGFALDAILFSRHVGPRAIAGVIVGLAGLALVFLPQIAATHFAGPAMTSFLLAMVSTALFALGSSLAAATQKHGVSVRGSTAWAALYGCLAMGLIVLLRGDSFAISWKATYLAALGWHVVVATVIAFSAYVALVGEAGIGRAAYTTVVFPVIALALSTLVEGLARMPAMALGVLLVGLGNVLVLRRPSPVKRIAPLS